MTSPNATFTELVTTTFRKHSKAIRDNVSKNNAFLARLDSKGGIMQITALSNATVVLMC
jgi:hypothetical protein